MIVWTGYMTALRIIILRVHKSYIVNYKYVRKIYASKVIIDNGEEIQVSRNRRGEINRICMQ